MWFSSRFCCPLALEHHGRLERRCAECRIKAKHSAFFCTPLDLLRTLKVNRLLLTGVATDQCIVTMAVEARMRDYEVEAPADCTATQSDERDARMLRAP